MTPLERYEQGRAFMGTGHVPEANPELRFLLWPPAKRATAKVNGRTGIVVEGIRVLAPRYALRWRTGDARSGAGGPA